ncbi:MAG: alpha-amylase family glycosyl hydrolase [Bradymonadaceae bacterium]
MANENELGEREIGLLIAAEPRRRYDLEPGFFDQEGRAVFESFGRVREFARRIDERRGPAMPSAREGMRAGQLRAAAVLDLAFRLVVARYCDQDRPGALEEAAAHAGRQLGQEELAGLMAAFVERYPPAPVFDGEVDPETFVAEHDAHPLRRHVDLWCLHMLAENPAVEAIGELFEPGDLADDPRYEGYFEAVEAFFDDEPAFGDSGESLFERMAAPQREASHSLDAQLEVVHRQWGHLLPEWLRDELLTTLDVIREEEKAMRFGAGGGGDVEAPDFERAGAEKRYSRDSDWMPRLVLIAKNARVWLTQLSRKYDREISRLQEIPGEELKLLADRGITGLWLIGIWERSEASERIKRMTGNPDAVASAYAIDRYRIAEDLGGREGKRQLEEKARQYGLRLAADMVPNHMGIDSDWVVEHPDRFLSLDQPPFPAYSFDGPDVCENDRVEIRLEDHYYDQSDAAVVFERVDAESGETRYIYHGNDGTSMPWNDTAQVDFLNPEAREAVIDQILAVAREFSIIRFDAAMTLAKEQIHRLWYPAPGEGGAIPSRAEHGMSEAEFEEAMPREFWREVVERIQQEAPETLLLAEAFWKMEGYFVRSLGMHRVYNSAFMNMLRDEDNAEYRGLIKETLSFDPQILKRYVNFLNNPDEETALEQFGKGDKYFGICTLMATMPGLPMFGHGQIEGLTEKYGMDFDAPLLDEEPDEAFVQRHRDEIFPVLHRRELFADVEQFRLYDIERPDGSVDENVFAYSNRHEGDRSLVVYHNRYGETRGWVRESVPFRERARDEGELVRREVAESLEIPDATDRFVAFRDLLTDEEYLRSAAEIARRGLYVELDAYDAHVFVDFRTIRETDDESYRRLCDRLAGRGTDDLEAEMRRMQLQPVLRAARRNLNPERLELLSDPETIDAEIVDAIEASAESLAEEAALHTDMSFERYPAATVEAFEAARRLPELEEQLDENGRELVERFGHLAPASPAVSGIVSGWVFVQGLAEPVEGAEGRRSDEPITRLGLDGLLEEALHAAGLEGGTAERATRLVRLLVDYADWPDSVDATGSAAAAARALVDEWFEADQMRRFLGVNEFEEVVWFHDESMQALLGGLARIAGIRALLEGQTVTEAAGEFGGLAHILLLVKNAAETSDSRVDRLVTDLADRDR